MGDLYLSRLVAVTIFVLAMVAGGQFRRGWKAEAPRWKLWVYGLVAGIGLLTLSFIPVR